MGGEVMGSEIAITPVVAWALGLSALITFGTSIWNLVSSGARANAKILQRHTGILEALIRRMDKLENQLEQVPSSNYLHRLELSLTRIDGELATLNARLEPVANITDRMQELLLHGGGKK